MRNDPQQTPTVTALSEAITLNNGIVVFQTEIVKHKRDATPEDNLPHDMRHQQIQDFVTKLQALPPERPMRLTAHGN